jgi:tRNA dimethylallyltransferase
MIDERTAVAVVGPTCSGKTVVAVELAKLVNGEVISADARQIYKMIDIGTAKPTREEMSGVEHHLVDILPLENEMSAGAYAELAAKVVDKIFARNRIPVIVGGSGLYLRALIDGLFDAPEVDPDVRHMLRERVHQEGSATLLEELKRVDAVAAEGLIPQNYSRILRALEVYHSSGKKISELRNERPSVIRFSTIQFGIRLNRNLLYSRIEKRVDEMIRNGFVHEVKDILDRGVDPKLNSLQTVGYKEVISYLQARKDGATPESPDEKFGEVVSLIKMNTRRYAKRQMTWFNKDKRIFWIDADDKSAREVAEDMFTTFANSKAADAGSAISEKGV